MRVSSEQREGEVFFRKIVEISLFLSLFAHFFSFHTKKQPHPIKKGLLHLRRRHLPGDYGLGSHGHGRRSLRLLAAVRRFLPDGVGFFEEGSDVGPPARQPGREAGAEQGRAGAELADVMSHEWLRE